MCSPQVAEMFAPAFWQGPCFKVLHVVEILALLREFHFNPVPVMCPGPGVKDRAFLVCGQRERPYRRFEYKG